MSMHGTLDITLLGREYRVTCPPDERESLLAAVQLLEARMSEIGNRTRSTGERLAVMAALNLAHDLICLKQGREPRLDETPMKGRIESLINNLDGALNGATSASVSGQQA